jgi:hypothetical protein
LIDRRVSKSRDLHGSYRSLLEIDLQWVVIQNRNVPSWAVRFARYRTLFYDEDVTNLPRRVSAVNVGMKAMEIRQYGHRDV